MSQITGGHLSPRSAENINQEAFAPKSNGDNRLRGKCPYWKTNRVNSNYANFKIQNMFEIKNNVLQRDGLLSSDDAVIRELFKQSGIQYSWIDISAYKTLLNEKHSPEEYIRGKYVLAFFVKALRYISSNASNVLPSKIAARPTISLGYEDAVSKLCGIMRTPETLRTFFQSMKTKLIEISA